MFVVCLVVLTVSPAALAAAPPPANSCSADALPPQGTTSPKPPPAKWVPPCPEAAGMCQAEYERVVEAEGAFELAIAATEAAVQPAVSADSTVVK